MWSECARVHRICVGGSAAFNNFVSIPLVWCVSRKNQATVPPAASCLLVVVSCAGVQAGHMALDDSQLSKTIKKDVMLFLSLVQLHIHTALIEKFSDEWVT